MTYTVQDDPRVDAKIEHDLGFIRQAILEILGARAKAVLLTGAFGRGEGGVEVSASGTRIINDYDIAILLNAPNQWRYLRLFREYHRPVEALAERLARELQMKQVDLVLRPLSYFAGHPPLKIENYEVRNGHRLLHGDTDPCEHMPDWRAEDIPLFEGTWLFRNRGLGLLIAAAYLDKDGQVAESDRENFVIECTKALLAIGDSVLLLHRQYHFSYAERARRAATLPWDEIPDGKKLQSHYLEALHQKLRPDFDKIANRDLAAWWTEIGNRFDQFFRYYEAQRLGQEFDNWLAYEQLCKPEDRLETRKLIRGALETGSRMFLPSAWRLIELKANPSRNITLMALLLFARLPSPHRAAYLARGAALLGQALTGSFDRDWAESVSRFLLLIHPGGEAGRVAARLMNQCLSESPCRTVKGRSV